MLRRKYAAANSTNGDVRDAYTMAKRFCPRLLTFGQEGRELLDLMLRDVAEEAVRAGRVATMVEVGVWLGHSVARWASLHESLRVVGVDPFKAPRYQKGKDLHDCKKSSVPAEYQSQYKSFGQSWFNKRFASIVVNETATLRHVDSRVLLVEGFSPQALLPILQSIQIDAFYIDGGKNNNCSAHAEYFRHSLDTFYSHNPNAIVSGDDYYHHSTPALEYILIEFAKGHGLQLVVAEKRTWIMAKNLEKYSGRRKFSWIVRDPVKSQIPHPPKCLGKSHSGNISLKK